MKRKIEDQVRNQKGEAMLVTTILLLVLVVIVGACSTVASMQWDMTYLQRKTSNTYYLAKSGVEKGVEVINKAIETQTPIIVQQIRDDYLTDITDLAKVRANANDKDSEFYSDKKIIYDNHKIFIKKDELRDKYRDYLYGFICANYIDQKMVYQVQGDGQTDTVTQIEITFQKNVPEDKHQFKIICKASVGKSANPTHQSTDIKEVVGLVELEIPGSLENEIHEAYNWLYNPAEILDSALTCFSDVVITSKATLTVQGDMRVKGTGKSTTTATLGTQTVLSVPDINEIGGVIASNGGQLEVKRISGLTNIRTGSSYLSSKNNMIISNKKKVLAASTVSSQPTTQANYSTNTGSIYCVNNVMTTQGWEADGTQTQQDNYSDLYPSIISAEGDVIASTVAICDDFYSGGLNQTPYDDGERLVSSNEINVEKNVFVDNDVVINRYVTNSNITVEGSIFGISDGDLTPAYRLRLKKLSGTEYDIDVKDPNSSSGVFNEGGGNSRIKANGMFVNGQPFIDFGNGGFYKVYESIGEPYKDIRNFYDAGDATFKTTNSYLAVGGIFANEIKKSQIHIEDHNRTYVPNDTKISALFGMGAGVEDIKDSAATLIKHKNMALEFFYKEAGDSSEAVPLLDNNSVTGKDNGYGKSAYFKDVENYYKGENIFNTASAEGVYFKKYTDNINDMKNYKGLRGYMLSKRSIFYGEVDGTTFQPQVLSFNDVIGVLPDETEWSYSTPIDIVDGNDIKIDISDYYVEEEEGVSSPYPTIVINRGGKLTIKTDDSSKKYFKGIIISEGNVVIEGPLTIEGALIIGGNSPTDRKDLMLGNGAGLTLSGEGTHVEIIHNPDVLFHMNVSNKPLFREVLDALKITQFGSGSGSKKVSEILGPYPYNSTRSPVIYTTGRVKLSGHSVLDITTDKIRIKIKTIKKING